MSVRQNLGYGLKVRRMPKAEIRTRVEEIAELLGLTDLLERKPAQLSGGQRQRVAMGRAIVRQPQAFLMDEPLSNLDAKLRVQMRAEIARLQSDLGVTTIYVTHDQTEAMTMGNRVAVMRKGELQQVDDPQVLYDHPVNLFVGGFIGSPAMNMLQAKLEGDNGTITAVVGNQRIRISDRCAQNRPGLRAYTGRDIILGIRPENLEDAAVASSAEEGADLNGEVVLREALGSEIMAHVAIEARAAETDETRELARDVGAPEGGEQEIGVEEGKTILVARFNARSRVHQGDTATIAVDTDALHFFDPETGAGIYEEANGARAHEV
jgi:multiple sugar transport system ATP-binding protein